MRRRWLRLLTIALAALGVVGAAAWWVLWRPVRPAAALLGRLAEENPSPAEFEAAGARKMPGPGSVFGGACPEAYVLDGPTPDAPLAIVVAGVTPKGIEDPRVWRLLLALHEAGFAVVAPRVEGLEKPGESAYLATRVGYAWSWAVGHTIGGREPTLAARRRVAFVGVSLGGGVVLHTLAKGERNDPPPSTVSAVLLVGAPFDTSALALDWFRSPAARDEASALERQRASDGRFARHGILRGAMPRMVPSEIERTALRGWIDRIGEDVATEVSEPSGVASSEARRWLAAARAEESITDVDRDAVLQAAQAFLHDTSPAAIAPEGLARVTMPVFLIHGVNDPLVPASEADALAARLARSTSVRVLKSRLLGHVEVGSPGLLDAWEHVRWVQRFLDAAAAAR